MSILKSFKNIIIEIEVYQEELKSIDREIELYKRHLKGPQELSGIEYSDMPKGNSTQIPLDRVMCKIIQLQQQKQEKEQLLQIRQQLRNKVEDKLKELEGLDNQVVYMRDVKGMKLDDIAQELNISEIWAKKISARNKRVYQEYTDILKKM